MFWHFFFSNRSNYYEDYCTIFQIFLDHCAFNPLGSGYSMTMFNAVYYAQRSHSATTQYICMYGRDPIFIADFLVCERRRLWCDWNTKSIGWKVFEEPTTVNTTCGVQYVRIVLYAIYREMWWPSAVGGYRIKML